MNTDSRYSMLKMFFQSILPLLATAYTASTMSGTDYAAYISIGSAKMHAITALSIIIAFLVASSRLEFLSIPWRYLAALSLIVLGGHLYDVMWGFASLVARGSGFPWVPLFSFALTGCVVVWLDMKLLFLKLTEVGISIFVMGLVGFAFLINSGFYQQMTLYETVGGADPSSLIWAVGKVVILLVFPFCTLRGRENRLVNVDAVTLN